jgi:hypothetical protein
MKHELKHLNDVMFGYTKTLCIFVGEVQVWATSTWNIEINSPFTTRFGISMATSCVCPLGKWVGVHSQNNKPRMHT